MLKNKLYYNINFIPSFLKILNYAILGLLGFSSKSDFV